MTSPIARLEAEHANFEKLLNLLEAQLDIFHAGGTPDYVLMLDVMYYMTQYPDRHHHPSEDLALARLAAHSRDFAAVAGAHAREHALIAQAGIELHALLNAVVNGAIVSRRAVEHPGRLYISRLRDNMRREQAEFFPLAAARLGEADWRAIEAQIRHQEDPVFGARIDDRYLAIHRQIARHAGCGCAV